jgi:hypothetical protein
MVPEKITTEMITLIVATIMTVTNDGGYTKLRELVVNLFQRIIFNQKKLKDVLYKKYKLRFLTVILQRVMKTAATHTI